MNGNNEKLTLFLLGNSAVGKTSFISKYVNNNFSDNYISTVGIDFFCKTMKLSTGEDITLKFYDTAGQEVYRSISYNLVKSADGIFLLYDITKRKTFDAIYNWIESIKNIKEDKFPVILIGNKCDIEEERDIDKEEGQKLADENGFPFIETSCKDGINIEESVKLLVSDIIEKKKLERENENNQNVNKESSFRLSKDRGRGLKNIIKCCI